MNPAASYGNQSGTEARFVMRHSRTDLCICRTERAGADSPAQVFRAQSDVLRINWPLLFYVWWFCSLPDDPGIDQFPLPAHRDTDDTKSETRAAYSRQL